jgi:formylglycine-generating enzyme required for sulfatase activity
MARFPGDPRFLIGNPDDRAGIAAHEVNVGPFELDTTEVTVAEYEAAFGDLPPQLSELQPPPGPDAPVVHVLHHDATAYAEAVGKRLPTEGEYEFAATAGAKRRFPWGDSEQPLRDGKGWNWRFGDVRGVDDFDHTDTDPPVYGLFSNVAEWTSSFPKVYPFPKSSSLANRTPPKLPGFIDMRVVRGGTWNTLLRKPVETDIKGFHLQPSLRQSAYLIASHPGLGFRCARSTKARFLDP